MKTAKTASRTITISDCALSTSRAPTMLTRGHRDDDGRGEDVVPAGRGVVADEERRRVAAERDGHHRADDHDRGEVAEPGRDPDEPPVPEALEQVRDEPAGRRVADAELDDLVAEQRRDEAGEQEREPDRGPRDRAGLAEEREDAGADHGADAEEGGAADAHRHGLSGRRGVWPPKKSQTMRDAGERGDDPADLQRQLEASGR